MSIIRRYANANNRSLFKAACVSRTFVLHAVNFKRLDFMNAGVRDGLGGSCYAAQH